MDPALLKKRYLAAAAAAAGITGAIIIYAIAAELLFRLGHKPPLLPPAAYAVKYGLYMVAIASVLLVRAVPAGPPDRETAPEQAVKALAVAAILKAALCEVPAVCGLILLLLTGYRADFYLLLVFAAGLEVYHFPRLSAWKEHLRREGQL